MSRAVILIVDDDAAMCDFLREELEREGFAVANCGLKSLGMDHGTPAIDGATVWYCSDEHTVLSIDEGALPTVGERVRVWPAHIDPTIAYHERMQVIEGDAVVDTWTVDLRGW